MCVSLSDNYGRAASEVGGPFIFAGCLENKAPSTLVEYYSKGIMIDEIYEYLLDDQVFDVVNRGECSVIAEHSYGGDTLVVVDHGNGNAVIFADRFHVNEDRSVSYSQQVLQVTGGVWKEPLWDAQDWLLAQQGESLS